MFFSRAKTEKSSSSASTTPSKDSVNEGLLPPDTLLKGYRIVRTLCAGQSNNVYVGLSPSGQEVAIKEYFPRALGRRLPNGRIGVPSEAVKKQFEKGVVSFISEAVALAEIKSDLLVKYVVAFRENGTAYLVTELEPGETLEAWARRLNKNGNHPDEGDLRLIFWFLLHAVQIMHEKGFLHLDIKPSNVIMRDEFTPILIDLGGARPFPYNSATAVSISNYTPGFAAPEQQKEKRADFCPATDIYGIGASILYCMTGKIPPTGRDRMENDTISELFDRCKNKYSKELIELVQGCLMVSLDDRFSNVKMLQNEISKG